MRLLWIATGLAILFLIPFLIWGDNSKAGSRAMPPFNGCVAGVHGDGPRCSRCSRPIWCCRSRPREVMSAAGYLYGALIGGAVSAVGSFLSGMIAYGLCRAFGHGIAERLAGKEDLRRGEALFRRRGAWLVALSRWLPLLPEVIACLAGATRMPFRTFTVALACGSVPLGFVYAAIGAAGQSTPASR